MEPCSIGIATNDSLSCHKTVFCRNTGWKKVDNFTETEKKCLFWRSNLRSRVEKTNETVVIITKLSILKTLLKKICRAAIHLDFTAIKQKAYQRSP